MDIQLPFRLLPKTVKGKIMDEIEITDDQIVDLIFERKIDLGQTKILATNSFHEILAKLEERLCNGKISRSKNPALCGNDGGANTGTRIELIGRPIGARRKKIHDLV